MNENIEIWADIDGYEKLYQVSSWGRVRSLDRLVRNGNGYRLRKGRILKPALDGSGYQYVNLWKNGKMKSCKIHRLVAQAFIPNPQNLPQINHIDENKTNNRVENLEYCDCRYNINYGSHNERVAKANTNGKTSKRVAQINPQANEIIRIWPSTKECGRNGFNQGNVAACCRNCYYGSDIYKSYKWQYIEDSI